MRFGKQVIGMALIIAVLSAGFALAVGYERHVTNGPSDVTSTGPVKKQLSVADALMEASFIEKFPACLDSVAGVIKGLLGQFGLVQNDTP